MISDHVRRWTSTKLFALHTIALLMLIAGFCLSPDKLTPICVGLTSLYAAYAAGNTISGLRGPAPPTDPGAP